MSAGDVSRFWSKVARSSGCWIWTGALRGGYGRFRVGGQIYSAHRVAWELLNGPLLQGGVLDHGVACGNRRCVRPSHLEVVTLGENTRRSNDKRFHPIDADEQKGGRGHD